MSDPYAIQHDVGSLEAAGEQSRRLGYEPLAISEAWQREGEVPHGAILIRRPDSPFPSHPYAVQDWGDRRGEMSSDAAVLFSSGSYDLTFAAAAKEFADRLAAGRPAS